MDHTETQKTQRKLHQVSLFAAFSVFFRLYGSYAPRQVHVRHHAARAAATDTFK